MSIQGRHRAWPGTLNNWSLAELESAKNAATSYYIIAEEVASTPHLQAYFEWPDGKTLSAVKRALGSDRWHLEVRRGTSKQAADYCRKEDVTIWEQGVMSTQGKRKDLDKVRDLLKDGNGMGVVVQESSSMQSVSMAKVWLTYHEEPREWPMRVTYIYGPTGTGKTRWALERIKDEYPMDWYVHSGTDRWWDGYDGQSAVLLDDIRGDFATFHRLLRILDRYPCRVEIKGAYRQLRAKLLIITSDLSPECLYPAKGDSEQAQLLRRITTVVEFSAEDVKTYHKEPAL